MKFRHGFELKEQSKSRRLYTCGKINAQVDFVSGRTVRVAIYRDSSNILPSFNINPENELSPLGRDRLSVEGFELYEPKAEGNAFELDGGVKLVIEPENFLLSFYLGGKRLFGDRSPLAYNLENEFGDGVFHYVTRERGEEIFGLGDKGGALNKAGRAFRIETADCMGYDAAESDPLYKHIPFYICKNSVGSYAFFYDTGDTSYIDLGREINNYYEPYKYFRSEDDCLVYYVFIGSIPEILKEYGALTGRQALPPKWSFDYCASTMAYTDAEDAEPQMYAFLDKILEADLSCKGFYLSSGYTQIGTQRYVFNWSGKFPNPREFIKRYADSGIELIPNIKPAFLDSHPLYETIKKNGWFVKNPDGTPFVTQFWDGLGSYLDFTNPDAFAFWSEKVTETLLDLGINATWNDNNEFDIKDSEALAHGFGSAVKANRLRPALTYLMVLASYTAQLKKAPKKRPFLSTRSGGVGVRRLAQTWSGDNRSEFADLRYCHNIGLTMSLSGLYFYGHDLGGFSGDMPSRELLLRWLQHGVFEPRFTIHSWNSDGSATMPWSYPDILDGVRAIFAERYRLAPYLYNCAYRAVKYEEPLNAPLFFRYDDAETESSSMLVGRDILASFVFDEGADKVSVYLPKGDDWYLGGKLYKGGSTVRLEIPANAEIPYFVRSGSVIPTNEAPYGCGAGEKLRLTVYPLEKGEFDAEFFTDDGESFGYLNGDCVLLKMHIACNEDTVEVRYENAGNMPFEGEFALVDGDGRKLVTV
jgi:alpha-glucosidase